MCGLRASGSGLIFGGSRISGFGFEARRFKFRVQGLGLQVSELWVVGFGALGLGFQVARP